MDNLNNEIFGRTLNNGLIDIISIEDGESIPATTLYNNDIIDSLSVAQNSDRDQQCNITLEHAQLIGLEIE